MRKVSFILASCIMLMLLAAQPAFAAQRDVTYLEDGSYYSTTVETSYRAPAPQPASSFRSSLAQKPSANFSRVKASKRVEYRSKSGKLLWYVKVTGSFAYDGEKAVCLRTKASAKTKASSWKVSHKRAWKSRQKVIKNGKTVWRNGNRAYASATGKLYRSGKAIRTVPKQVFLTCSPSGKIR